jgi:uncharacterized protein (TIGR03545 family)
MSAEKKTKKPPKPAAIYRKPILEKKFKAKYLKLIELPADKAFLESSFTFADGAYVLKGDLDRSALLRLNKLAKAIKANRGFVKTGPLIAAALVAGGGAVFVLFFMNPVLERATERGLEAAFGARAEVSSFKLQLSRLRVSLASVVVADRDKPMENLFETGRIELRLDPASLIRGRVYIEEASAASIAVGTARKTSGALPGVPAEQLPPEPPKAEGPPLVDFENFDAAALLEQEKSKLKATAAYAEAAAAFDEASARWKAKVEDAQKTAKKAQDDAKAVLAIDPKKLNTPEAIAKAAEDAKKAAETAKAAAKEVDAAADGVRADWENAQRLEKLARAAAADDYARLKSYIDPKSGAALEALEPSIREILSDKVEKYIYYGQRSLAVAQKLKAQAAAKGQEKPAKSASRGRDVVYPAAKLPRFRLGVLTSSFAAGDRDWSIELREVSSDPDLVPAPTTFKFAAVGAGQTIAADAVADLRSSAERAFSVDARGEGLPVDLGDALKQAGFGGFTGTAELTAAVVGEKDGRVSAESGIDIGKPAVAAPKGLLAKAVAEALGSADAIELDVGYLKAPGKDPKIDIDTNIDNIVAAAMRNMAERYAKKALADLEKVLQDYVGKELAGKLLSKDDLSALASLAAGDKKALGQLSASVDAKRKELENRAKAIVEEQRKKAEAAAKKKAEEEAKKAAKDAPKIKF